MFRPHLSGDPHEKRSPSTRRKPFIATILHPKSSPGMLLTLRHLTRLLLVSKAEHVLRFSVSSLVNLGCEVWEDQA